MLICQKQPSQNNLVSFSFLLLFFSDLFSLVQIQASNLQSLVCHKAKKIKKQVRKRMSEFIYSKEKLSGKK